jgi:hypothetical protein
MVMARRLVALNLVAGALACLFAVGLVREIGSQRPLPPPPVLRLGAGATAAAPEPAAAHESARPAAGALVAIAAKNLFSPTRSEAPTGPALAVGPKPLLYGVVMNGPTRRAYLEDPVAKRVFGYGVGDAVGGGRVESINPDRVVIGRPDGRVEVLLQDPSKPRATSPAGAPGMGAPAKLPVPGTPVIPAPRLAPPRPIAPGAVQR